jgi:hypothetical protein
MKQSSICRLKWYCLCCFHPSWAKPKKNLAINNFGLVLTRALAYARETLHQNIVQRNVKVTEVHLSAIIERIGEAKFQEIISKME